ncbi:SprT family protein [Salirhabdus salicampi]|uniref:SprT family protein n=1 Tax=Salirhabdus salicampi TaxID=476102 RepID=UPI0020C48570|nr:SprT family protein [Salirhabdus salicampi]MCP8618079.1 SprT family protein [Salirhabdus salicampi]
MTNEQLLQLVKTVSLQDFEKPFPDNARFNGRLRTTGGRYIPKERTIEINPKYLEEIGMDEVIGIIKHELCHYHLHVEGKGYQHRDPEFKELLRKTNSPRFCRPLPSMKKNDTLRYQCISCGHIYSRKRQVNTRRYGCGKCKGRLKKV